MNPGDSRPIVRPTDALEPSARHGCEAALDGWMHGVCAGFFLTQVATLWGVWWGSRA